MSYFYRKRQMLKGTGYSDADPRDEGGRWTGGGGGSDDTDAGMSDEGAPHVQAAKALVAKAKEAEPAITATLESVKPEGAEMVGLEYKVKSESSTARKVRDWAATDKISEEEAASRMVDMVRYTMVSTSDDDYNGMVRTSLSKLKAAGETVVRYRNYWGKEDDGSDPMYQGINVAMRAKDGHMYELQFHTRASYRTKEELNHAHYEVVRSKSASAKARTAAIRAMVENQKAVAMPKDVETVDYEGRIYDDE